MKKRIFVCLMLAALLALSGCRKDTRETTPSEEGSLPPETTEVQSGPVQDSIFDDEGNVTGQTQPAGEENEDKDSTQPTEDKDDKDSTQPTEDKDKNPTEATRPGENPPDSDGPVDPPAPDDPDPTSPATKDPEPTGNPGNNDTVEVPDPEDVDYREFMDMTPAEQQAFMESFESIEAFFEWYEAAKAKYEEENPPIDVGDGNVTLPGNP